MILSLPALFRQVDDKVDFHFRVSWDDLAPRVHGLSFVGEIDIRGLCWRLEDLVMMSGRIQAGLLTPCDRCLKECQVTLDLPFQARYVSANDGKAEAFDDELDDDGLEAYSFQGDQIDLTDMLQDEILLNLPSRVLCKEDCKGMCTHCGCNLNEGACDCTPVERLNEALEPRLQALKHLIVDDEEV